MKQQHIVILGGGFGGVNTYKGLPRWVKQHHRITLIDKHNHFLFTPLLPEVAGANLDQHNIIESLREITSNTVKVIRSTVVSVDTQKKQIELTHKNISYDILISALGSRTHFFGTPGAEEHAYTLKDMESAVILRNRLIDVFEEASQAETTEEKRAKLRFVIVGGGATGAELAGELAGLMFKTFVHQFRDIDVSDISLMLVNGSERILGMFDETLQRYAECSLAKDQVEIRNNVRVSEVDERGVVIEGGERINAETVIWAAGVTANSLTCSCGSFLVERGRIKTNKFLQAQETNDVFIVGDMALSPTKDGRGLPMTAQIAKQQGRTTGRNIGRLLQGKTLKPFVYREKGLLASLGQFQAVGKVQGIQLRGPFAWFLWRTIYLFNFASWPKRFQIMGDWTINLFSKRDTTRL